MNQVVFFFLYNILSAFLLIPVCLYHLYRSLRRGRPPALAQRFGRIPPEDLLNIQGRPVIWLHAVSVGEAIAARPLLKALRQCYPGHALLVSTTTETGRSIASGFPEKDLCVYFPFDFLPAVRGTLNSIRPELIVVMETEIWPNFTREAARRGIPVILANGRISDRSFTRYLRFRWFFRHALQLFSSLCMQTAIDRERIIAIGAPPELVQTTGNLKYDIPLQPATVEQKQLLRKTFNIPQDLTVICAGSTHPGEEELVLAAYRQVLATHRNIFLILVPRHPERAGDVAHLLASEQLSYRRRTQLNGDAEGFRSSEVLLVDTIGELMNFYALADMVFVGGSLVPTGGHNLLEPASLGVPSLFGPHMTNFREIAGLVLTYEAGVQVQENAELSRQIRCWLDDPASRLSAGKNGLSLIQENGGATARHMQIIVAFCP